MNDRTFGIVLKTTLAILAVPQFVYRFRHPEMSETQLFLNFFNAYGEFFK